MLSYNRPVRTARLLVISWILLCSLASVAQTDRAQLRRLQKTVTDSMRGRQGSAVVLDVASGKIIASFNLENAARRLALPGSAVKPFTLLALLRSGKVDSHSSMLCRRRIAVGSHKLDCGHPQTGQPLDAISALAYSCNDYFTTMALRLSAAQLQQEFLRWGLGARSQLSPHDVSGQVELSASQEQLQLQSIGETNIRVTPLLMAAAYRKLAQARTATADASLTTVFAGIDAATDYGMARLAQPGSKLKVSGKTGTSLAESGLWTHAWFAGFAPSRNPEIVVVVFLERGSGGADAAPIAARVFDTWARGR